MYGMGPGPGGGPGGFGGGPHGPGPGGPHGFHGGPHGPYGCGPGPYGCGPGPYGHHGHHHGHFGYGPGRRGFFFFPFFMGGRRTAAGYSNAGVTQTSNDRTRTVKYVKPDGTLEIKIEYIDEEKERKQNTLWGKIKRWFADNFTI